LMFVGLAPRLRIRHQHHRMHCAVDGPPVQADPVGPS